MVRFLGLFLGLFLATSSLPASKEMARPERYTESVTAWAARADAIRKGILVGAHLWPLPERTPLNPIFSHKRMRKAYSVENIAFEATPGFYVFGNLYRPLHRTGQVPAILVPHGHFKEQGWFARTRPENQELCASLAKMGAVVFTYDMVGWGDSQQKKHNAPDVLELQLWDSIRAVDFVESLPEVDSGRIGVTGASGGATQTIYLAAVDPRIKASMPVAMVSSTFTGHDPCEDGMKVHEVPGEPDSNNVEIAAVIAPKPLMVISDGADWTRRFPEDDFPFIQRVYELMGAPENAQNVHFAQEKHDYGPNKRKVAYRFFAKVFGLREPAAPDVESVVIEPQIDQAVRNWIDLPVSFFDSSD